MDQGGGEFPVSSLSPRVFVWQGGTRLPAGQIDQRIECLKGPGLAPVFLAERGEDRLLLRGTIQSRLHVELPPVDRRQLAPFKARLAGKIKEGATPRHQYLRPTTASGPQQRQTDGEVPQNSARQLATERLRPLAIEGLLVGRRHLESAMATRREAITVTVRVTRRRPVLRPRRGSLAK